MKQSITIDIDVKEGYELKFNPETMTIEQVKKEPVRSKSWEEFCKNHQVTGKEYYINNISYIHSTSCDYRDCKEGKNLLATEEDAEGILALIQLTRLHDEWVGNWKGDYTATTVSHKYAIAMMENKPVTIISIHGNCLLDFPTQEMAKEFLNCFRDLIEKAKRFI